MLIDMEAGVVLHTWFCVDILWTQNKKLVSYYHFCCIGTRHYLRLALHTQCCPLLLTMYNYLLGVDGVKNEDIRRVTAQAKERYGQSLIEL
jgi:hypothetical protein